jgi:hypothetical protein
LQLLDLRGFRSSTIQAPAQAFQIQATVQPDVGNILGEYSGLQGQTQTQVQYAFDSTNQFGAKLVATSFVDLASGVIRGSSFSAAQTGQQGEIRFVGLLRETITLASGALPGEFVTIRAHAHGGFTKTNAASAKGGLDLTVNTRHIAAAGSTEINGWSLLFTPADFGNGTAQHGAIGADGATLEIRTVVPQNRQISLDMQLDGDTYARYGSFDPGPASAYVDMLNTASLEIITPHGVAFTSTSGVFLTTPVPEPQSWALLLAGLGLTAASIRGRRRTIGI